MTVLLGWVIFNHSIECHVFILRCIIILNCWGLLSKSAIFFRNNRIWLVWERAWRLDWVIRPFIRKRSSRFPEIVLCKFLNAHCFFAYQAILRFQNTSWIFIIICFKRCNVISTLRLAAERQVLNAVSNIYFLRNHLPDAAVFAWFIDTNDMIRFKVRNLINNLTFRIFQVGDFINNFACRLAFIKLVIRHMILDIIKFGSSLLHFSFP